MNTPTTYLTPSEFVYLNGEKFAPKAGVLGKTRLLHMEFDVNATSLVQAILAAAFLTLEQQGTLRLEIRPKKALFGLVASQGLYADSVGPMAAWHDQTLEYAMPGLAYQLATDHSQNEVYKIVYTWLGQDVAAPFEEVLSRVKSGLAARGLLETRQDKFLKIFTRTSYTCPETTRQLAVAQPIQAVQQLFAGCQQARPELWEKLNKEIKRAVSARQEQSDDDFDDQ